MKSLTRLRPGSMRHPAVEDEIMRVVLLTLVYQPEQQGLCRCGGP